MPPSTGSAPSINSSDSDVESEHNGNSVGTGNFDHDDFVLEQQQTQPIEAAIQSFMGSLENNPREILENLEKNPQQIFDSFPKLDSQSEIDGRTVLHCIVDEYFRLNARTKNVKDRKDALDLATKTITRKYPYLLKVVADDNTSPLYRAIAESSVRKDDSLIISMVFKCKIPEGTQDTHGADSQSSESGGTAGMDHNMEAQPKRKHPLTEALEIKCSHTTQYVQRTENVLHLALRNPALFTRGNSIKALIQLARRASEESVLARDADGFTPVHYAANYAWSSNKRQLEIIQYLLAVGDSPILIEEGRGVLEAQTGSGLSIYEYHLITRHDFRKHTNSTSDLAGSKSHVRSHALSSPRLGTEVVGAAYNASGSAGGRDAKGAEYAQQKQLEKNERVLGQDNTYLIDKNDSSDIRERDDIGQSSWALVRASRRSQSFDQTNKSTEVRNLSGLVPSSSRVGTSVQRVSDKPSIVVRVVDKSTAEETVEDKRKTREEWSNALQIFLKVRCLRTRSHEKSAQFLYGNNEKHIQTCFDYQVLEEEIDMDTFVETFKNVTFDSVLKYVALPLVRVRGWKQSEDNNLRHAEQRGRSDMLFFFNWLRKRKGVKQILKVIIQDSAKNPHSDEAIEMSLKNLGVENLDWSKPDLDPNTIYIAAPKLTHVTLRWSGNNAILRAWGDHEGLRRLPYLKVVYLLTDQTNMLESQQRVKTQVEEFKSRLQESCPTYVRSYLQEQYKKETMAKGIVTIKSGGGPCKGDMSAESTLVHQLPSWLASLQMTPAVECFYGHDAYGCRQFQTPPPTATSSGDHSTPPHQWLDATDDFAERIHNIWNKIVAEKADATGTVSAPSGDKLINSTSSANTSTSVSTKVTTGRVHQPQDVIVAVIDDGVNIMAQQLSGKTLTGRTFASAFDGDRYPSWFISETGHGTVMASMITRVCPMAKIYPIRLDTGTRLTAGGGAMIKPDSVPQAIRAAVDRGASIISMSWTITEPHDGLKVKLEAALQYALDNNVLLLCSNSDLGHGNYSKRYPAAYRENSFIKIGAAQPSGLPYDWVGDLSNVDFILPGVEVVNKHPHRGPGHVEKLTTETGSSVATALGAGLAALILYCAQIQQMYGKSVRLKDEDITKLLKAENMVKAMSNFGLSTSKGTEGKFIEVWNKLDSRSNLLSTTKGSKAREIVAELARDLISPSALK